MTVAELIETLQRDFKPDEHICPHLWVVADIKQTIADYDSVFGDVKFTEEDYNTVLDNLYNNCDSELGITNDAVYNELLDIKRNKLS